MRLLIVEDDVDGGEILRDVFESEGFEVVWARTGEEAIGLSSGGGFAAALVDLSLPDLDGTAVLIALRRALPGAALALVTGFAAASLEGEVRGIADRIFEKPTDPELLLDFVRQAGARPAVGLDAPAPAAY
ncbi:MAG: response regulator [Myxococcales bacterium]